jgi:RNA-dependent RNA polymerase
MLQIALSGTSSVTLIGSSVSPVLVLLSLLLQTPSSHMITIWILMIVTDEDQQKIQSSADRKQLDEVYTRVYKTLKNGITVGGRHFEFLAFGNSQLRDHGCYMFNSNEHITADMIREWMGIFDGIKSVAKYAGIYLLQR